MLIVVLALFFFFFWVPLFYPQVLKCIICGDPKLGQNFIKATYVDVHFVMKRG